MEFETGYLESIEESDRMNILCWLGFHKWRWYLPIYPETVIGTQWCIRCKNKVRGKCVKRKQDKD